MNKSPIAPVLLNTLPPLNEVKFPKSAQVSTPFFSKKAHKTFTKWNSKIKIKRDKNWINNTLDGMERAKKKLNARTRRTVRYLRPKRVRVVPLRRLVRNTDIVFSKWIRARDNNTCVICGSTSQAQCGHLFKRGKHNVRFNELNCNTLCPKCNYLDNFEHDHYVNWFLKKYGERKYAQLYMKSLRIHKFTREELYDIIKKYSPQAPK